jgi:hypothetical protein
VRRFFRAKLHPINEIVSQREHSQNPAISDEPDWLRSNRAFNLHVSCSSLRRVPEMPHSISAKFPPVSQRIVSDPAHRARRHRVDPVLFLPYAACVQSVEFDRLEAIRNLQTSLSSRLRLSGGSVRCDPSLVGWSLTLQLSSFQNQVCRECAVLVKLLRDKYPLCNNESDASAAD